MCECELIRICDNYSATAVFAYMEKKVFTYPFKFFFSPAPHFPSPLFAFELKTVHRMHSFSFILFIRILASVHSFALAP